MASYLQAAFDAIKREARAGVAGDYTEQYTTDLLTYWNRITQEMWKADNWDYSIEDISFTLAANTSTAYALPATIGKINILGISGQTGYLRSFSEKQYRQWQKKVNTTDTGTVYGYVKRGLNASQQIQVLFVDTPADATLIEGEGKKRLVPILLADVAANSAILYFPDDVVEFIKEWVAGVFMTAINDPRGPGIEARCASKLKMMIADNKSDAADEVTSPPPDLTVFGSRQRGGTRVT